MLIETNSRRITQRLQREGWVLKEGSKHSIFKHPDRPAVRIVVPRHREVSFGVAASIARLAGWEV